MTLIFSSGGGRLGNQLLNIIHLNAISYEYDISIYKINDSSIISKDGGFIFKIDKNKTNWIINPRTIKRRILEKLFLKIFIRIIHLYHFILPNKKSFKIGMQENIPKFIIGKYLGKNFPIIKIINEAKKEGLVITG